MKADEILHTAAGHLYDRAQTYDTEGGERSMRAAVAAFNALTGHDIEVRHGWLLMALVKAVRAETKPGHTDSLSDLCAYTALYAEEHFEDRG